VPIGDYVMLTGLKLTNIKKIGKIVTLYQLEMLKKISLLGTFCTQSVNEGLINQNINMLCFYKNNKEKQ
jgi:hypothetical protein